MCIARPLANIKRFCIDIEVVTEKPPMTTNRNKWQINSIFKEKLNFNALQYTLESQFECRGTQIK